MQLHQPLGQRQAPIGMDGAVGDVAQTRAAHLDDAPAGVAQAGIEIR